MYIFTEALINNACSSSLNLVSNKLFPQCMLCLAVVHFYQDNGYVCVCACVQYIMHAVCPTVILLLVRPHNDAPTALCELSERNIAELITSQQKELLPVFGIWLFFYH
jgi:hypothetical protein